jgi:hypothetical protein
MASAANRRTAGARIDTKSPWPGASARSRLRAALMRRGARGSPLSGEMDRIYAEPLKHNACAQAFMPVRTAADKSPDCTSDRRSDVWAHGRPSLDRTHQMRLSQLGCWLVCQGRSTPEARTAQRSSPRSATHRWICRGYEPCEKRPAWSPSRKVGRAPRLTQTTPISTTVTGSRFKVSTSQKSEAPQLAAPFFSKSGAVRNVVGIRCDALSGNMKISFQAARSIG